MEGRKIRRYDKEFKISAVKMITEGGESIAEIARSLDLKPNVLYSWKRKYSLEGEKVFIGKGNLTELSALRRKLRDAEMEIEILKRAVGIFSKDGRIDSSI